jgi:hypothetical protein
MVRLPESHYGMPLFPSREYQTKQPTPKQQKARWKDYGFKCPSRVFPSKLNHILDLHKLSELRA